MTAMTDLIKQPWSPYLAGASIGLLNVLSAATVDKTLGITSPFENAAAVAGRRWMPETLRANRYFRARDDLPKLDWEAMLVIGVAIGSAIARSRSPSSSAVAQHPLASLPKRPRRLLQAVLGGAMMIFGARMAKGCTSGHGISGAAKLAASSWMFIPIFAVSAVATSRALFGRGVRR
jgi:uncharacterized protein